MWFSEALRSREFEPDAPNYTPRISGMMTIEDGAYSYQLSILKSAHGCPDSCERFTYGYASPLPGKGISSTHMKRTAIRCPVSGAIRRP